MDIDDVSDQNREMLIDENIKYLQFLNDVCKIGGKEFNFK